MTIRLGADPELFLVDATGAFIAACGRIGGTKQEPLPLEIGDGFAVQEDNVALEYNIPASASKQQFVNNITRAMSFLSDMVATKGLAFSNASAVYFPQAQLMHPLALEFGCDPDYNAWKNGKTNPRPKADDATLRTCGGHVHVGTEFDGPKSIINFIKYMDKHLGVPSVLMDEGDLRKKLYGKPGAFRFKPYGCEYRVLSNFWVHEPKYTNWVWDATEAALADFRQHGGAIDDDGDEIQYIINNNDKRAAEAMINRFNLTVA